MVRGWSLQEISTTGERFPSGGRLGSRHLGVLAGVGPRPVLGADEPLLDGDIEPPRGEGRLPSLGEARLLQRGGGGDFVVVHVVLWGEAGAGAGRWCERQIRHDVFFHGGWCLAQKGSSSCTM